MKKSIANSLHYVLIYAGILLIAAVLTATFRPKHQSDKPAPTPQESEAYREQDSINFRAIRSVEQAQVDYVIPDSAMKR